MTPADVAEIEFSEPWHRVAARDVPYWRRVLFGRSPQLVREVGPLHPLFRFRKDAIPIARRSDTDDWLYFLPGNAEHPLVCVHLTYSRNDYFSRLWPATDFYSSLAEWQESQLTA